MSIPRHRPSEFYDSAYGLPDFSAPLPAKAPPAKPPPLPAMRRPVDSTVDTGGESDRVVLSIASPALRRSIATTIAQAVDVAPTEDVSDAAVIIADAPENVRGRLAELRRVARPDAAIIVVLEHPSAEDVATAHSAGAYACLRPPFVREEILSFVASALDSRAAKVHAADLARQLDLDAHLASIGRITAGLSHEIRNPLAAATLNVQVAADEVEQWKDGGAVSAARVAETLAALKDAALAHGRLDALLVTLRDLVRNKTNAPVETVDVHEAMLETRRWVAGELVGVEVETLGGPARARADATMLGQILQNLVANAAHAAKTLSSPRLRLHVYQAGDRVVASVRDNGPGIPPDLHDKIFEPFFTTRRGQGGTGLGLALCREYAIKMGADLSFWSLPGRGTCFRVSLLRP